MTHLKLPRSLEGDARTPDIEASLTRDRRPLWSQGTLDVARVTLSEPLVTALTGARLTRSLERGQEHIEQVLAGESKGLEAARAKQGAPVANRISRLLVMANDGSERFNRHCESTLKRHADRVLGLMVDADSETFSSRVFGEEKLVKVVLVTGREVVAAVLLALAA